MSFNITIRVIGMLLFAVASLLLGLDLSPRLYGDSSNGFNEVVLPLTIGGALVGFFLLPYLTIYPLRWVRHRLRMMPALDLISAAVGLFVGLLLGALLAWPLSTLPGWLGQAAPTVSALVFGYLGIYASVLRKRDVLDALRLERKKDAADGSGNGDRQPRAESLRLATGQLHPETVTSGDERIQPEKYLLVDTSAIIDGRIADISKTGFLDGVLLVPRFVLNELQHIADSADSLRRARGRRGLDMLNRLQKESVVPIQVSEVDAEDIPEVDGKLVKIARVYHCPIITNDFNLNRVAEIQGVKVLNINELANAVKPVVLPGEEMNVHVIQEGKELGQGVAYLDDGTMVVVENGKKYMHNDVDVVVTRVLQTVAGRMIFAQMKNGRV
ncbi:MAG: PIN domain nuclease [Chloroflexota bacterium]|nr:PIN domain nuclease [Chloroflexota bacterium]